jgi:hypothetical protein
VRYREGERLRAVCRRVSELSPRFAGAKFSQEFVRGNVEWVFAQPPTNDDLRISAKHVHDDSRVMRFWRWGSSPLRFLPVEDYLAVLFKDAKAFLQDAKY